MPVKQDKEIWHAAPEIQVLDDDRHRDGKNPKDIGGIALRPDGPRWQDSCDRWASINEFRLILRGNHGEHWLNGVKVVEYELGSPTLKELICTEQV